MIRAIAALLVIAAVGAFSIQNFAVVPIAVFGATYSVSLFAVVVASLLAGLGVSLILGAPIFSAGIKEKKISPLEQAHKSIDELNQRMLSLEHENTKLRRGGNLRDYSNYQYTNNDNGLNMKEMKDEGYEEGRDKSFIDRITRH